MNLSLQTLQPAHSVLAFVTPLTCLAVPFLTTPAAQAAAGAPATAPRVPHASQMSAQIAFSQLATM